IEVEPQPVELQDVLRLVEHRAEPRRAIDQPHLLAGPGEAEALRLAADDRSRRGPPRAREDHVAMALVVVVEGDRLELLPAPVGAAFARLQRSELSAARPALLDDLL